MLKSFGSQKRVGWIFVHINNLHLWMEDIYTMYYSDNGYDSFLLSKYVYGTNKYFFVWTR